LNRKTQDLALPEYCGFGKKTIAGDAWNDYSCNEDTVSIRSAEHGRGFHAGMLAAIAATCQAPDVIHHHLSYFIPAESIRKTDMLTGKFMGRIWGGIFGMRLIFR
jgi:hypothetical protein